MFKRSLFGLLFIVISSSSYAEGWSGELIVDQVITEGKTDLIVIYTSGGDVYTSGCLANKWSFTADNEDRRGRAYSTAMTALASGKKIKLWYTDTCGSWSYHEATSIMLLK